MMHAWNKYGVNHTLTLLGRILIKKLVKSI